jgi:tRNA dimethylallyltransferase
MGVPLKSPILKMLSAPESDRLKLVRQPVVIILGPTAVGKTEISIQLAERLDGEIISADSRLFYREMDIGTAKPSKDEMIRVPHHLIDIADPDDVLGLSRFQKAARQTIQEIRERGRLPFLVGGTGQYIRAVIEDWDVPKVEPSPALRNALERWSESIGPEGLHQRLSVLDPVAAEAIDFRNLRRTIRALEVVLLTGKMFSAQKRRGQPLYHALQLGLNRPRPELYERVDWRVDAMIEAGLVDEVQALLQRGYSPDLPSLSAIGYREIIAHLQGRISLEEATTLIKRSTRILVRRQANWFKESDPDIHWFTPGPAAVDLMELEIKGWLKELNISK